MGVYVYCLAEPDARPPDGLRGVDDSSVVACAVDPFIAWCSAFEDPPSASVERIRRHNAVVEAAASAGATLPVRFGQWLESAAALAHSVRAGREAHEAAFRRVAGAVEFAVSVVPRSPRRRVAPVGDADRRSGRAYMEALVRRAAAERTKASRGEDAAAAIRSALGPLARDERVTTGDDGRVLARIAHLVRRGDVDAYRRTLYACMGDSPRLQLLLTGPWPPYSFVG